MSEHDGRLADRVRDRPLAPDLAARLLLPLATALASRHAAGDVHLRISPTAVVLQPDGSARLLDRAEAAADPAFTAPEVAGGAAAGTAADVWAFGGLLLQATTAHPPYSPRTGPRGGGWLRPLIQLALHPDPQVRPTMAEVAAYLRARDAPGLLDAPAPPAATEPDGRGGSGVGLALAGAALVALLGAAGAGLLLSGGGGEEATDDGATAAPSVGAPTPSQDPPAGEPDPTKAEPPTSEEIDRFARSYVATASSDPERGFARLTRSYQQASPRYHEVWTAIEDPEVLSLAADPAAPSVTYTYRYRLPDGTRRTERVTLQLVQRGSRLLIAGASALPL